MILSKKMRIVRKLLMKQILRIYLPLLALPLYFVLYHVLIVRDDRVTFTNRWHL